MGLPTVTKGFGLLLIVIDRGYSCQDASFFPLAYFLLCFRFIKWRQRPMGIDVKCLNDLIFKNDMLAA